MLTFDRPPQNFDHGRLLAPRSSGPVSSTRAGQTALPREDGL